MGTSPEAWEAFDDVVGRHRAPQRRYHGVRHVTWTVRHVRELAAIVPVTDEAAVIAAAFFHDAVYDVAADDNEARSAALAERVLGGLGWSADRCAHVVTARQSDGRPRADRGCRRGGPARCRPRSARQRSRRLPGLRHRRAGRVRAARRRAVAHRTRRRPAPAPRSPAVVQHRGRAVSVGATGARQHGGGTGVVGTASKARPADARQRRRRARTLSGISFGAGRATAATAAPTATMAPITVASTIASVRVFVPGAKSGR